MAYTHEWPLRDDVTGRMAVAVADYAKSDLNGETNAYWHIADAMGGEEWTLIDGVDLPVSEADPLCDVWFASGQCIAARKATLIYVSAADYAKLGGAA